MFTSRWDSELAFLYAPRIPYSISSNEKQIQDALDDAGYETVAVIPNEYFSRPRWPSVTRGFQRVDDSTERAGKHNAPGVTDAALRILSENRDQPLYLWVHYYDAHPPYLALSRMLNAGAALRAWCRTIRPRTRRRLFVRACGSALGSNVSPHSGFNR